MNYPPLDKFYVIFEQHGISDMTYGRSYQVTFNGADRHGYLGYDDNGVAFGFSAQWFSLCDTPKQVQAAKNMTATQVSARNNYPCQPIPTPSGDFTHMGRWNGPNNIEMVYGKEYNLIYDGMSNSVAFVSDLGNWLRAEGCMFDVTHDYSSGHPYPSSHPPAHPQRISPSGNRNGQHDSFGDDDGSKADIGCDMTGITVTTASLPEDWTEDGDPVVAGPESTEDLRQYRFKPDLF